MNWINVRRKIIVLRTFMNRAYAWLQPIMMITILVGVINPYLDRYYEVSGLILIPLLLIGLIFVGYLDRIFGFHNEDAKYQTQRNQYLLDEIERITNNAKNNIQ